MIRLKSKLEQIELTFRGVCSRLTLLDAGETADWSLAEVLNEIQEIVKQDGKQAQGNIISKIYSYDFADNENYEEITKLAMEAKPKKQQEKVVATEEVEHDKIKLKIQPKNIPKKAEQVAEGSLGLKKQRGFDLRKEKLRV